MEAVASGLVSLTCVTSCGFMALYCFPAVVKYCVSVIELCYSNNM